MVQASASKVMFVICTLSIPTKKNIIHHKWWDPMRYFMSKRIIFNFKHYALVLILLTYCLRNENKLNTGLLELYMYVYIYRLDRNWIKLFNFNFNSKITFRSKCLRSWIFSFVPLQVLSSPRKRILNLLVNVYKD